MSNTNHFLEEIQIIKEQEVKVTSYQIGILFYCHVSNIDPGATIARGKGASREAAKQVAVEKATRRIS